MAIKVNHFDTLTRQNIDIDEKIENSLAEYLFPNTNFSIGVVYQSITTPEDLENYEDKFLQFASGERMYFADQEVRSLLYPNQSDGAAYGSLVFTPCQSFKEINARILVVNDETGDNDNIMPLEVAKQLVGDCYGKISLEMADKLTGLDDTPFQYRLAIKPQAENSVYRIAKGTLAPAALDNLSAITVTNKKTHNGRTVRKIGYDLILPTSSFKGRKKGYDPIEPGEYNLKIGIGVKTLARYGEQSLGTQVLVNYPNAVKTEILNLIEDEAEKLVSDQFSPQKLAYQYIELYERRKQLSQTRENQNYEELKGFNRVIDQAFGNNEEKVSENDHILYKLLKADKHGKITEHPKIIEELKKFVQKRWLDIATGRSVKFQAGMAQPSLKLKEDEICIPHIAEGKEIIVTRSPLINSNGVIILKNRHLPLTKRLQGVVHINPATAIRHLQADFDGDRLAFELAEKFPILAKEVKEHNLEQNRYPEIVKRDKIPYQGTFAEIALSAADNQIGAIANQIQTAVALRWEARILPEAEKMGYVKNITEQMSKLLEVNQSLPDKYHNQVEFLATLPKQPSAQEINQAMKVLERINFNLVADLGNELQVAVDGPKSANRPNQELLSTLKAIGSYKYPQWLSDKKNPEAYRNREMKTNGYSPIDLMITETNKHFQPNQLQSQLTVSFRSLVSDIKFDLQQEQLARSIRDTYNSLVSDAIATEKQVNKPVLKATSATSGKTIEISDLFDFVQSDSPIWKAKTLDIGIKINPHNKNELLAVAIQSTGNQELGTISANQVKQFGLKPGYTLRGAAIRIDPGISKTYSKQMFTRINNYLDEIRQNTPELVQPSLAAALWNVSHTKTASTEYIKKASVAFNLFSDHIAKQLEKPPAKDLILVGSHHSADYSNKRWQGETVSCEVVKDKDPQSYNFGKKIVLVEGKPLAVFTSESASLAQGAKFKATLHSLPGTSVVATTVKGNTVKIEQIKNFAYSDQDWQGESAKIILDYVSIKGKKKPVALLDNKILGVIERDSANKLEKFSLISNKSTLSVKLVRSLGTTTNLTVDLDSLSYSWQSPQLATTTTSAFDSQIKTKNSEQNIKYVDNLSSIATIASTIRDFLDFKNTEYFKGQKYTAAWDKNEQLLIMKDVQGSIKLEAKYDQQRWHSRINTLTESEIIVLQEMIPKLQHQLNESKQTLEQQRQNFREEYQRLKNQVIEKNPHYHSENKKLDTAVATLIVAKVIAQSSVDENSKFKQVGQVLSMSDRVLTMKQTMPEVEYRAKAKEYIIQIYQEASLIRDNSIDTKRNYSRKN